MTSPETKPCFEHGTDDACCICYGPAAGPGSDAERLGRGCPVVALSVA